MLLVGVMGVILLLMSGGLVVVSAVHASTRARIAADQAALAGAAVLLRGEGDACDVAAKLARANRAALTGCSTKGFTVTIDVAVSSAMTSRLGFGPAYARSRAGPDVGSVAVVGAPARSWESSSTAPRLSSGSLPLPHLGDWTHAGQPCSQGQAAMAALVADNQIRAAA